MTEFTHPLTGDVIYRHFHPSGLEILVWPRPRASSAYAVFAARYGSVYNTLSAPEGVETVPEGIAHFLEHKLFESEDGDAFARFAATGASANAYTSFDRTCYLFQATENILPSLEILLDFVQHPYFTDATVEKEQGIIGQEIKMCEDNPGRMVLFNLLDGMYHRHPVRIDIAGTTDSIAQITPDLLYRSYGQYYNLHNMVLSVAGRITPEEVMDAADRLLKPAPVIEMPPFAFDEPDSIRQAYIETAMPVAAPLFYLGYKEPAAVCRDAAAFAGSRLLLEMIAGSHTDLYNRLMRDGLINEQFGAEYFNGPGYGVWLFGGESADPQQVAAAIDGAILRIARDGVDPTDLETVRRGIYGRMVAEFDDSATCAETLLGNRIDGIEPLAELDAVASLTAEQLTAQIRERIPVQNRTLSVVNPTEAD